MSTKSGACNPACDPTTSSEDLNSSCYCISLDDAELIRVLEADLGARGLAASMVTTHPHLFASRPVFLSRNHVERMARVIAGVEQVVETAVFRDAALEWAPEIARFDPGTRGGLLGFDFHLSNNGPRLIEINTNPGGALINAVLGRAQRFCCKESERFSPTSGSPPDIEESILDVLLAEWRAQRGSAALSLVAIVDEHPLQQYLYPEFLLFRTLLQRHGVDAVICDPSELAYGDGVWHQGRRIDYIYNRLTDFALQLPGVSVIRSAYLADQVVLSPHPRAHALYADKRDLTLLGDESFLAKTGLDSDLVAILKECIPLTVLMNAENRAHMWENRRHLFFKPAAGYGSKAAYRGDKLTKRVWEEISASTYVAQEFVAPSERRLADGTAESPLKVDIRVYAYAGSIKQIAARLYQGQTTNFRTVGGGFAPVFTN